ncbi:MAG: AbrB/MazE/SpoVT family DNA-binding domain-containing protein [Nitrososphaerales archaeon]
MPEESQKIRTKISKGFQVVVPSELRKRYKVREGDEVIWEFSNEGVHAELQKKPSLENIVSLGHSGSKSSSVKLKKMIQKGDL